MLNMSNLSIELELTEKSYTFLFKDTCLDSVTINPLDMLPRQNWGEKLTFLLSDVNLKVSFLLTNK